MDYLIVQNCGRQLVLKQEQWYDIDYIKKGEIGSLLCLNKILMFKKNERVQLGFPFLSKAKIVARIIQKVKGRKLTILKTKPKKKYTRTRGHRQLYTRIELKNIF